MLDPASTTTQRLRAQMIGTSVRGLFSLLGLHSEASTVLHIGIQGDARILSTIVL
jgi:hypothetical protein